MRAAWSKARNVAARYKTTARAEFGDALKATSADARHERSYAMWAIEQDAEAARVSALPADAQAVVKARNALLIAEHNDTIGSHALVAAAWTHLASLQQAV
ncbi:hypothetical protein [Lichenihabitans psoromatis]|uniref:hypothetical protein n=1 Tax=Lichenihabitans psoromatis TaxID=2528642 RepID=UPI0010369D35|nr:hypothetical protein [Lichenihabitans psoromatis]